MSGHTARALALLALLAAGAARAEEPPCAECRYRGDLAAIFVPARALGPGWDTMAEEIVDPRSDPDLRAAGVEATQSLHYTREVKGGGAEVCSVEIWSFTTPQAARRARADMQRESWRFALRGNLITMLRGVSFERGHFRPGLRPACTRLAELIEARAAELLRDPDGARPE